jgi:hypothetical protein
MHAPFQKQEKRVFHREILRPAEDRVLQNMGNPLAVLRRCLKGKSKKIILLVRLQMVCLTTGSYMTSPYSFLLETLLESGQIKFQSRYCCARFQFEHYMYLIFNVYGFVPVTLSLGHRETAPKFTTF